MNAFYYDDDDFLFELLSTNCTAILGISREYEHLIKNNITIGTIATSFVVAAFAIAFALSILFIEKKMINRWMVPYFTLFGIAYAIEAACGIFFSFASSSPNKKSESSFNKDQLHIMVHYFLFFSMMALLYGSVSSFTIKLVVNIVGIGMVVYIMMAIEQQNNNEKEQQNNGNDDYWILSYYYTAIYFLVMIVQIREKRNISATGCSFILIGSLLYLVLDDRCGFKEEEQSNICYEHCPLPHPWIFDHKALRNTFLALGLLLQAIGETTNTDTFHNLFSSWYNQNFCSSGRNNNNNVIRGHNHDNNIEEDGDTVDAANSEFSEDFSV